MITEAKEEEMPSTAAEATEVKPIQENLLDSMEKEVTAKEAVKTEEAPAEAAAKPKKKEEEEEVVEEK